MNFDRLGTGLRAVALALGAALVLAGTAAAQTKTGGNATDSINPYSPRHEHPYRHGVVPTREAHRDMKAWAATHRPVHPSVGAGKLQGREADIAATAAATGAGTLSFDGGIGGVGAVSGTPKVYLVFWGSQWGTPSTDANGYLHFSGDPRVAAPYMQAWIKGLGTAGETWSGVMTQYCDGALVPAGSVSCPSGAAHVGYPTGGALAGVWYDNATTAPTTASGRQIAQEAIKAAGHFGNTTAASNRYVQYIIMSPTHTHPDGFNTPGGNFCAWHDFNGDTGLSGGAAASPYGNIAFTNMPYVSDLGASCGQNFVNSALDGFSLVGGHEYAETLTDQFPAGGWINNTGSTSNGEENGDECAWISSGQGASALVALATGSFAMQSTWSNDTNRCDIAHAIVTGGGSTGGQPTANFSFSISALTATFADASTDVGGTIGSHAWSFGDGATSTATSPSHTYAAAGSYTVSETVRDSVSGATSSKSSVVTLSPVGGTPVANFSVATSGLTATFTDTSTDSGGTVGTHSWSFGDGSTSTAASPSHTYATAGTYSVSETVTDSVSGQSSSKTAAVTVSVVVAPSQLLGNPGFETGAAAPWAMTAGVLCSNAACAGESAHSGSWFAWLDGYGTTHTDVVSQSTTLPLGKRATLSFALHIDTQERGTTAFDRLRVQLLSASGAVLRTLATYSNVNAAPGYAIQTFDLSTFAGQSVMLRFTGTEDSSLATSFLIDDVTINVQ